MYYYEIRILNASKNQIEQIDEILGIKSISTINTWNHEVIIEDGDRSQYSFIDDFLSILAGKYDQLERIGIDRDSITFWMTYVYEHQCNMEFDPVKLAGMGREGITLCISCWEK